MTTHPRGLEADDEAPGPRGPGARAARGRLVGLTRPPLPEGLRRAEERADPAADGTARLPQVVPAPAAAPDDEVVPDRDDACRTDDAPDTQRVVLDPERVALDETVRGATAYVPDWDAPDDVLRDPDADDPYDDDDDPDADDPYDDAEGVAERVRAEMPLTALPDAPGAVVSGAPLEANPTGAAPARTGRAGRDMVAAVGVGLGLGAIVLVSLFVYRPAFVLVLTAAVLISLVELTRALRKGHYAPPLPPLVVGALAMVGLAWTRGPTGLVVGFFLTVFAVLLYKLGDGPVGYLRDASTGVLVALYVPLLAGFAVLLTRPDDGVSRVIAFIATVVASDVGGFAAGVLFGRHAMAPSVSPKKSWEGMAGSVTACALAGGLLVALLLDGPWWGGVLYGVAIAVTATLGDLAESLIKRDLAIKDMGTMLPGHGGLMDRMDSLLPSAAVAYLILSAVVPV